MSAELAKKKRVRGAHKASATKIMQQIVEAVRADRPDEARLASLRLSLNEEIETVKGLDADVIDLMDDDGIVEDIDTADEFKETVFRSLLSIDRTIEQLKSSSDPKVREHTLPTSTTHTRVKLPKLQLRSFSGDLTQWTSFWDSFHSAIHNSDELSEIEKFNYLNSLLERSAKEAISGFSLTAVNYREAIATLKKRFGGKQQIVDKHLDVLFNVEPVVSTNNVRGLRRLFDTVTAHIRSLQSLEVRSATYASTFCLKLLSKLPNELRLIISRSLTGDEWNLGTMLTAIEQELTAGERSGMNETSRQPQNHDERPPVATATALMSGNSSSPQPVCCYCSRSHKPVNCETVVQAAARKQVLKRTGSCFVCLKRGHRSRECRSAGKCRVCSGCHHSSICGNLTTGAGNHQVLSSQSSNTSALPTPTHSNTVTTSVLDPTAPVFNTPPTSTALYVDSSKSVLLQTAVAEAYNPTNPSSTVRIRIILDSGSQRSYLTKRIKNILGLQNVRMQHLSIATFGTTRGVPRNCEVVRVGVTTRSGKGEELELFIVPHICEPLLTQPIDFCSKQYSHLTPLNLADTNSSDTPVEVDMLVGSDFYWQLTTGEIIRGEGGPVAIETKLGWVLSGPVTASKVNDNSATVMTVHTLQIGADPEEQVDNMLRSFWELESFGIEPVNDSIYDYSAHIIKFNGRRYQVTLPWKEFHLPLPDIYKLSLRRLKGLLQRLRRDPTTLKEYSATIQEQYDKGIIESIDNQSKPSGRVHYLPHHAVVRRDKKTTKVRIVYDASARAKGPSLNDCLHTGPKFNQKILEILLYPVAWLADIEKAFLMVSMSPEDRDVLRFLWVDDPSSNDPNIVIYRFTRVVFGVSSSPYLLNSTIQHHLMQYSSSHPDIVAKLLESFYVDDLVRVAARGEQSTTLQRPLQLLYPLEIHCSSSGDDEAKDQNTEQDSTHDDQSTSELRVRDREEHSPSVGDRFSGTNEDQLTKCDDDSDPRASTLKRVSAKKAQERFKEWSVQLLDDDP